MTDKELLMLQDAIKGKLSAEKVAKAWYGALWDEGSSAQIAWIGYAQIVILAIESGKCWKDADKTQDAPERVLDNRKEVR